jgi:hypothetical protein
LRSAPQAAATRPSAGIILRQSSSAKEFDMKKRLHYVDRAEAARLRDYADQLGLLGKHAAANIWREMADRIEASHEAGAERPVTIWLDQRKAEPVA